MNPNHLVTLITAPTITWLYGRLFFILWRHHRTILFKIFSRGGDSRNASRSAVFSVHVLMGLGVTAISPFVAHLCTPPALPNVSAEELGLHWKERTILIVLSLVLAAVNLSALVLIPSPDVWKTCGCTSRRAFVHPLSLLYVSSIQYAAMPVAALGLLSIPIFRVPLVSLTVFAYIWTVVVCLSELIGIPWEENAFIYGGMSLLLRKVQNIQASSKSKLTQAFVESKGQIHNLMCTCFLVSGIVASVQNLSMLRNWLLESERPVSRRQETFFVLFSVYSTLVMSAGFFTTTQLMFAFNESKEPGRRNRLRRTIIIEALLTQALPLGLLLVGSHWTTYSSAKDFCYHWFLWKG